MSVVAMVSALILGVGAAAATAAAPAALPPTCTCNAPDIGQQMATAAAVFSGKVTRLPQSGTDSGAGAGADADAGQTEQSAPAGNARIAVDRVYKGDMITTAKVDAVFSGPQNCYNLTEGEKYIFVAANDEGLMIPACGYLAANTANVAAIESVLGEGRTPDQSEEQPAPEDASATFTPDDTSEPASVTRLAAPGAALVLVGLLGIFVVRRINRPRR